MLITTERLFWHCGAHTAEPKLGTRGPIPPIPYYQICCFLWHVARESRVGYCFCCRTNPWGPKSERVQENSGVSFYELPLIWGRQSQAPAAGPRVHCKCFTWAQEEATPHARGMMVICSPLSYFLALWSSHCQVKNRPHGGDSADPYNQNLLFSVTRGYTQPDVSEAPSLCPMSAALACPAAARYRYFAVAPAGGGRRAPPHGAGERGIQRERAGHCCRARRAALHPQQQRRLL